MKIPSVLISILIAMFGGLTNYLMDEKKFNLFRFITSLITAGFTGLLIFFLCKEIGINENYSAFLCGISGMSGDRLLKVLKRIPVAIANKNLDKIKKDDN